MTARIPLDPEPWSRFPEQSWPGPRSTSNVTGYLYWNPRPVIFASRDPLRDIEFFEGYEQYPTHAPNRIILDIREWATAYGPGDWPEYRISESAGYTPFEVAHARAVLTRLGNIDWKEWRA